MDAEFQALIMRNFKIEYLLDPLSRTRRDASFGIVQGDSVDFSTILCPAFVHYTGADAAISIIKNKNMWMRNASTMDDWSEINHGHQILLNFFSTEGKRERFLKACNSVFEGSGAEALGRFDGWWNSIQFNTYIASVSEHADAEDRHGRLSMWRAFGGTSSRVAIVFRPPAISNSVEFLNIQMRPVLYNSEKEVHAALDVVTENIEREVWFFRSLTPEIFIQNMLSSFIGLAVALKHSAFEEEKEWRIIYNPKISTSLYIKRTVENIRGVPQIVYHLPIGSDPHPNLQSIAFANMFERLIIGPTAFAWPLYEAFVEILHAAGIEDAANKIITSGIPLR